MSSSYSYEWACGIADSAVRELSGLDEGEEEVPTSLIVRAIDILKKRTPFTDAHGRAQDLSKVLRLRSDDAQARREANAEGEQYEEYAAWRKGHLPNEQDVGEMLGSWIPGRGGVPVGDVGRVRFLRQRYSDWPALAPHTDPTFPCWERAAIDEWMARHPEAIGSAGDPLTVAQVAEYVGLSVRTVQTYRTDGRMPPATMIGRTPTWTRAQIDQWMTSRPGQGARTDLR